MPGQWQIRFDDGHQQRYLPDRQAVLRYVLAIGPKAASKRFEVYTEAAPILLSDGTPEAARSRWPRSSTWAAPARPGDCGRNWRCWKASRAARHPERR